MNNNNKTPHSTGKFNGILIGDEYTGPERIEEYICDYCNMTLTRLTDRNGNNESWYCNNCSIEFNPEDEQIRHKQRLSVPNRNTDTLAATTPGIDYLNASIQIHKEPEIKGGLKVLKDRGIRITSYSEHIPK